jgi:hypothetical protein
MARAQWLALAQKRLISVLRARIIATDRTLEQKISDAGPNNQRIEPLILTQARKGLVEAGRILTLRRGRTPWFYLSDTPEAEVKARLELLEPIYDLTQDGLFKDRLGQSLEIAIQKALQRSDRDFLGIYDDLGKHDDSTLYHKIEPPQIISGRKTEKGPLDFIVFEPAGMAGIEVKNYRTWIYPDSTTVKNMLWKCTDLGAVPVLITRRIPFITFRLLNLSGCIVHQTYNQLYATADAELAELTRDKDLLGYHDVRIGNEPDKRLTKFIQEQLPNLVETARPTFKRFNPAHVAYGRGLINYTEWVKLILVHSGIWKKREEKEPEEPPDYGEW